MYEVPKLKEYFLIEACSSNDLNKFVNNKIAEGWELYQHPIMGFNKYGTVSIYLQAMVKYEKVSPTHSFLSQIPHNQPAGEWKSIPENEQAVDGIKVQWINHYSD